MTKWLGATSTIQDHQRCPYVLVYDVDSHHCPDHIHPNSNPSDTRREIQVHVSHVRAIAFRLECGCIVSPWIACYYSELSIVSRVVRNDLSTPTISPGSGQKERISTTRKETIHQHMKRSPFSCTMAWTSGETRHARCDAQLLEHWNSTSPSMYGFRSICVWTVTRIVVDDEACSASSVCQASQANRQDSNQQTPFECWLICYGEHGIDAFVSN